MFAGGNKNSIRNNEKDYYIINFISIEEVIMQVEMKLFCDEKVK